MLLLLSMKLLDRKGNKITFPSNKFKVPVIGFKIQIIKWWKWMKKVSDFRLLATKVQKDNKEKPQKLRY